MMREAVSVVVLLFCGNARWRFLRLSVRATEVFGLADVFWLAETCPLRMHTEAVQRRPERPANTLGGMSDF